MAVRFQSTPSCSSKKTWDRMSPTAFSKADVMVLVNTCKHPVSGLVQC